MGALCSVRQPEIFPVKGLSRDPAAETVELKQPVEPIGFATATLNAFGYSSEFLSPRYLKTRLHLSTSDH